MKMSTLFRVNPWVKPNLNAPPPVHPRGRWLNYRKLASSGYVPTRRDRAKLLGGRPYGIVIPWELDAQQTLEFQGVAPGYFAMLELVGDSLEAAGYKVLLYDPTRKRQLTERPIDFPLIVGDAREPFIFKKPYALQPKTPLLCTITNLATVANQGQIVVWGAILSGAVDLGEPAPGPGMEQPSKAYSLVEKPPWIDRPASGEPFTPASWVILPAIGETATIVEFRVPTGRSGVINRIANEALVGGGWNNGDGNLVWQILINGAAVKNLENIISVLGLVANPTVIDGIRLRENDLVQLVIRNVGVPAAGQLIGGRLQGYFYPKELDPENLW
jgi:hypothetical protein